ncbi:MAG: UPF0149 family protein [Chlorobiaceae bacterium]|jgi:uncharacterized protein|nr:UPF0149 family protein [Chlorobiaceae bacterium]
MAVYEVLVSLIGADPPVWRRMRLPDYARLPSVHRLIQMVMGWEKIHMHEFIASDRKRYGAVDEGDIDVEVLDESQYALSALLGEPGDRCLYVYDFGDDWVHELQLQSISEISSQVLPIWCFEGAGACPPENCGGIPGYAELLDSLWDRANPEHEDAIELLGESFDAEAFDPASFNDTIMSLFANDAEKLIPEEVSEGMSVLTGLRDFLESEAVPESAMSVMGLNGFFAALAIHPETIMPQFWLPLVWDVSGQPGDPEFSSKKEEEEVLGLLFTYYNSVMRQFSADPEGYYPLYDDLEFESDDDRMLAVQDWASGFMLGVMIDDEVWERTFRDQEGNRLLTPFAIISGMFDDVEDIGQKQLEEIKSELPDELVFSVLDLQEFWKPWRQEYLARRPGGPESAG